MLSWITCLKKEFSYAFKENPYPGVPKLNLNRIENKPFDVLGVIFQPIKLMHYKLPVFGYRIGDFAYCTDVNYIEFNSEANVSDANFCQTEIVFGCKDETYIEFNVEANVNINEPVKIG